MSDGVEGIEFVFSGLPIAFFNVALFTGRGISDEGLASRGQQACACASDKGVPWLLVVTHDTLEPGASLEPQAHPSLAPAHEHHPD